MITKRLFTSLAMLALCSAPALAQRMPSIIWQKCYGGSGLDNSRHFLTPHGHMMVHTSDGGYAFVGMTASYDGPVTGNHRDTTGNPAGNPSFDFWLVKLDVSGNIQWSKCYGGSKDESPRCLIQTSDGGFAMCGTTRSHDGDVTDSHPPGSADSDMYVNDAWIVKTDAMGNKQWAHAYGTQQGDEYFNSMIEVPDGYVAIGRSTTIEHPPEGHVIHGNVNLGDAMVVKLDKNGVQEWSQLYGGIIADEGFDILSCPSGGYIFAGNFGIWDVQVEAYAIPWIVRIDTGGTMLWQKIYRYELSPLVQGTTIGSMIRIPNGYLIAGKPYGFTFTIDTSGKLLSQKNFGSSFMDMIVSVIPTQDGNFVFAGSTQSSNVLGYHDPGSPDTLTHNTDSMDAWVGCFTPAMQLLRQRALGGDSRDCFYTVLEDIDATAGNTFMLYGGAESGNGTDGGNGDHPGNVNGYADAWVVKLGESLSGVAQGGPATSPDAPYPNPAPDVVNLNVLGDEPVETVQFYDLLGSEVFPQYQIRMATLTAHVHELPAGIYTIKVTYRDSEMELRKFLHSAY